MAELPANTTPFELSDDIFAGVSSLIITQAEIDLINSSKLLISLLHAFRDNGLSLTAGDEGNGYDGSTIVLATSGTDFVRLLGHELGHFYDHQLQSDSDYLDIIKWGNYLRLDHHV